MNASKFKKIPLQKMLSLVGIGILFFLFSQVDIKKVLYLWQTSNTAWIIFAIIILFIQLIILTKKWKVLFTEDIPFYTLFKVRMIGAFFGTITPANAGTIVRAHYLKQTTKIGLAKSSSTVVLDKMLELTSIALLGLISIILLSKLLIQQQKFSIGLLAIVIFFAISMFALLWLLTNKKHGKKLLKLLSLFFIPPKIFFLLKPYFNKIHSNLNSLETLFFPFILNLAAYLVSYLYVLGLVWAIGADISYMQIAITLPLSSLIALLPITISGIGTREATTVFLWSLFGVSAEQTLSIMLLAFIIGRGIPTILGWFYVTTFKQQSSS